MQVERKQQPHVYLYLGRARDELKVTEFSRLQQISNTVTSAGTDSMNELFVE